MRWFFGAVLALIMTASLFIFPLLEITYWYGGVFGWFILLGLYAVVFGIAFKIFEAVFPHRPTAEGHDIRLRNSN